MQDSAPVNSSDFAALVARTNGQEARLRDYMIKRRELLIIELSYIEDELKLPRTKEKRVKYGGD